MRSIANNPPRRGTPWRGLLAVAGLFLSLCLFLVLRDTLDPLRRSEAQRLADRAAQLDQQLATVDLFVAAIWRLAPALLGLPLGGLGLYLVGAIAWRRWADHRAIEAHYQVQAIRAANPILPALTSINYASAKTQPTAPALLAPPDDGQALAPTFPTFGQLLDQGRIGAHLPLLMGLDATTGQPFEGAPDDLYSCGIGAMPGAGKTWLLAFLLAQSALQGARLVICDPHAGDVQSLANRLAPLSSAYLCSVAQSEREILDALHLAKSYLDRRMNGSSNGRWQVIVVCDEWTSLLRGRMGAELPPFLLDCAEQGRKYKVLAALSAQGWTQDTTGGSLRNRLTAQFVLRQRQDEARYQLGMRASQLPDDLRTLPDGAGYLLTARGSLHKVMIPQITSADMERCGAMLTTPAGRPLLAPVAASNRTPGVAPVEATEQRPGSGVEAGTVAASTAAARQKALSPEAARVKAEIAAGKTVTEIAKARNGGSTSGNNYRHALDQVNALVREIIASEAT